MKGFVVLVVVVAPIAVVDVLVAKKDVDDVVDDVDVLLVLLVVVVVTSQKSASSWLTQVSNWLQHARYSPESGWSLSVQVSNRNRQFALRQNCWQIPSATKSTPQLLAQFR